MPVYSRRRGAGASGLKKVCRGAERSLWGLTRRSALFGTSGVAVLKWGAAEAASVEEPMPRRKQDRDDGCGTM